MTGFSQVKVDWSVIPLLEAALLGASRQSGLTSEVVSGAALLPSRDPARVLEHVAAALIDRLPLQGAPVFSDSTQQAFFRLSAVERALLVLLHRGQWDYVRMGALLSVEPSAVEELAWSTRLRLAFAHDAPTRLKHPTGSPLTGASCPEYFAARPWTQRWFDGRIQGRDRAFLQSHLERCEPCRQALSRAREIYYGVEKMIPRLEANASREKQLERIFLRTRFLRNPQEQSIWSATADVLAELLSQPRVIAVIFGICVVCALLSGAVR